jgi:hypothetical protein
MTGQFDKALMVATAISAIQMGVPDVAGSTASLALPALVALDRHTGPGKLALLEVSASTGVALDAIYALNFWCEGALLNDRIGDRFHSLVEERALTSVGLTPPAAHALWAKLRPEYKNAIASAALTFTEHIRGVIREDQMTYSPDVNI